MYSKISSWYGYGDPTLYFVGDHVGSRGAGTAPYNEARRFDWEVWNFVQLVSHEY